MSIPTEHAEQVAFVQWLEREHSHLRGFSIPNGGLRSKSQAAKLKMEGVSPGVPDYMIPELMLFIEFKRTKGGWVSDEQKSWHEYLRKHGYRVEVCRGAIEAMCVVNRIVLSA